MGVPPALPHDHVEVMALSRRVIMDDHAVRAAPKVIRHEARKCFEEIAEGLEGIPADSVFWESVRVSRLCLIIYGWAFYYEIDDKTLRVKEVRVR
jgi:hypothetical protein